MGVLAMDEPEAFIKGPVTARKNFNPTHRGMSDIDKSPPGKQGVSVYEFPTATYEEWKELASEQLKGAPFEKKLVTRTLEGIDLQPIYTRAALDEVPAAREALPGFPSYLRGGRPGGYRAQPWDIAQELPYSTPAEFNAELLSDLNRGQTGVNLLLDIATQHGVDPDQAETGEVGACGVSIATLGDLQTALNGVYLNAVGLHAQCGISALPLASLLYAHCKRADIDLGDLRGGLNMDPLGMLAVTGRLPVELGQLYREMAALTDYNARNAPALGTIGASGLPYSGGGASAVEELAFTLAAGVDYLRAMQERGLEVDQAAPLMRFTFALGPQFFMEIAKLRAARQLWASVVKAFGGSKRSTRMRQYGRTAIHNQTRLDPYVNMLRVTTEALSGVAGGVEAMHTGCFDEVVRVPDTFSRRIARNTQIILQEECDLLAVTDPAGGSWYIEKLTAQVAEKAWGLFQEVEKQGGLHAALQVGFVQDTIAKTAAERGKLVNRRRQVIVGTNLYPNLHEKPLEPHLPDYAAIRKERANAVADYRVSGETEEDATIMERLGQVMENAEENFVPALIEAAAAGATIGELTRTLRSGAAEAEKQSIPALKNFRLSEAYEALRKASREYAASHGHLPQIFLANMGPLRLHKARADFTQGFFAAGGFECIYPKGFDNAGDAAKAAAQSGAQITVICGTDDDYVEKVPAFCKALKAEKPQMWTLLAGDPGDHAAAYEAAGLDDHISIRSDNYETNRKYLSETGVL